MRRKAVWHGLGLVERFNGRLRDSQRPADSLALTAFYIIKHIKTTAF